jgi:hypothetical protein
MIVTVTVASAFVVVVVVNSTLFLHSKMNCLGTTALNYWAACACTMFQWVPNCTIWQTHMQLGPVCSKLWYCHRGLVGVIGILELQYWDYISEMLSILGAGTAVALSS